MASRAVFEKVLNVFDPQRSLHGRELDEYYVARPYAPLDPMKNYLQASQQHVKVLFSGHRGSGKSTEMARLAKDLDRKFFVVQINAARSLNLSDLNYVDIILACAATLFRTVTDEACPVRIPPKLLRDVHSWLTSEITQETTIASTKSGSFSARINALIFSLQGKYAQETSTREVLRERLFPRVKDLVDRMNAVSAMIEQITDPPLIIFEDLDKADVAVTRKLFFEHATTLNSPACRIIYTFPISLRHSHEFAPRRRDYSYDFSLPNISLYKQDKSGNKAGREALRAVISRRTSEDIFAQGALDSVVDMSGGLLADLIRLVQDAALVALTRNADQITGAIVEEVAAEMTNDYRQILLPQHYDALRRARETKQIVPDEVVQQLLANQSLLEYRNRVSWYDVHPAVRELLGAP